MKINLLMTSLNPFIDSRHFQVLDSEMMKNLKGGKKKNKKKKKPSGNGCVPPNI